VTHAHLCMTHPNQKGSKAQIRTFAQVQVVQHTTHTSHLHTNLYSHGSPPGCPPEIRNRNEYVTTAPTHTTHAFPPLPHAYLKGFHFQSLFSQSFHGRSADSDICSLPPLSSDPCRSRNGDPAKCIGTPCPPICTSLGPSPRKGVTLSTRRRHDVSVHPPR
jgi:hypothetical protein